ncbi:MFS transporter [Actinocorallia sp. API 0066]|uniref:MFS transporter n=1 Tax=Actinocorallia sp. API 0066 TaxID=2896846 RepID=UPI001E375248|nr:MFS transporter [Actinocorallia sp. API 0066]MCD0452580.1 MFS transporter [Actinocorallia sp. API 0066]
MSAWRRDFALLWAGSAASGLGRTGTTTALPLLALGLTGSPAAAGWAAACAALPHLLAHLPAGRLADRYDQRRIMLGSQSARLLLAAGAAWALLTSGTPPFWTLLVVAALDGTLSAFHTVAEQTSLPRVVPTESLATAVAHNEARIHVALLMGRPLGGFAYGLGRAVPYLADALAAAVSVVTLLLLRPLAPRAHAAREAQGSLLDGVRFLWQDAFQRCAVALCAVTNALFQGLLILLVVMADEQGVPPLSIGLLMAASGVGGAAGALVAPRCTRLLPAAAVPAVCAWGWAALVLLVAVAHVPAAGMAAWAGVGLLGSVLNVALATHRCARTPRRLLGRVTGVSVLLCGVCAPLGALAGGYAVAALGTREVAAALAAALVCLAVAVTPRRGRPAVPERALAQV